MKQLCFIHLPKTAGTSFRTWVRRASDRSVFWHGANTSGLLEDQDNPEGIERLSRFKVIGGHFDVDHPVLKKLPSEKIFCSVLRDPLERVISHYNHICHEHDHRVHDEIAGKTLYESLSIRGRFFDLSRDRQCRNLLGAQDGSHVEYRYILGRVDAMETFVAAVASEFDLPKLDLPRENVGRSGYAQAVRSQPDFNRAAAIVRETNRRDYELFRSIRGVLRVEIGGCLIKAGREET